MTTSHGLSPDQEAEPLRMDAYYYGFRETGVLLVDRVLSAVACAGKAQHHTEYWTDEQPEYHDDKRTEVQKIQDAANAAAAEVIALLSSLDQLRARVTELEGALSRVREQRNTWERTARDLSTDLLNLKGIP